MRFISNGFYFLIAIIAILWSFASSFEKDGSSRPKSDSFSNKNITSIKTIEYSNNMNTPTSNKKIFDLFQNLQFNQKVKFAVKVGLEQHFMLVKILGYRKACYKSMPKSYDVIWKKTNDNKRYIYPSQFRFGNFQE